MKEIQLTQGFVAIVDEGDYERLSEYKWYVAKGKYTNYAETTIRIDGKSENVRMHRMITSADEGCDVDHKDRNGLNNRRENLRKCSRSQNNINTKLRSDNTSGLKGVTWCKVNKNWKARININGKSKHLGCFRTKEGAYKEYCRMAKKHYGEFFNDVQ